MSAPVAGKFQDHYELLGIDPKATSETIQNAYSSLAQKYNPRNAATGDKEKFDAVNLAFEVLSDPLLRREFDKLKGTNQDDGKPVFSGRSFFEALGREAILRSALLCVLYDRRRNHAFAPSLSLRHLEGMLTVTSDELNFVIWYLKQRGLVASDDKSALQISVAGMDFLEANNPSSEAVLALLKPSALPSA